ncbi:MAG: cysteine hydrolase [Hyphomicrobiales bacterium]|nr:cysteine hydrolase [Hyphomicrobiales bacterium]
MRLPADATLIVIDVAETGDALSPPFPAANVAALLAAWRREELPIVHARSREQHAPLPEGRRQGEHEVALDAISAFENTALESLLEEIGVTTLILCGEAESVAASARDAGRLGYQVYIVADACAGDGVSATLAPLAPEWAALTDAAATLAAAPLGKFRQRWKAKRSHGGC